MPIFRNCEIWYPHLDPKRPSTKFPGTPSWEVQIRTSSIEQKKEWEEAGLKPKLMLHTKGEQEGEPILNDQGKKQWRVNIRKKSILKDNTAAEPVTVIDGAMAEVNPRTIGNGTIANIKTKCYDKEDGGKTHILLGVQLTKHIVYVPKENEDFGEAETVRVEPEEKPDDAF